MTFKKKLLIETGVFLLITFSIMMIFWWKAYPGGDLSLEMTGLNNFFYYLASFSPAIGCIITRYERSLAGEDFCMTDWKDFLDLMVR